MKLSELRNKIQKLAKQVYAEKQQSNVNALAYDELTKFPELKNIIIDLLTPEFDKFLESIDWVAPRPTTFRINLLNNQNFLLIFTERSWIAQIEGKKYYLLNIDEEERAAESLSRILQYGAKLEKKEPEEFMDTPKTKPKKSNSSDKTPQPSEESPSETPDSEENIK